MAQEGRTNRPSTRERLLGAAKVTFAEAGYHGARVSDIVRLAGVAQGTFYLHFKGKDDAFRALIEGFFEGLVGEVVQAATLRAAETPAELAEQGRRMWRGALREFHADTALARLILREARCLSPAFAEVIQGYYQRGAQVLAAYMRLPAVAPLLREGLDVDVAAWAIIGMFESVAYHMLVVEARDDVDALAEGLLELELGGLLRHDAPAGEHGRD